MQALRIDLVGEVTSFRYPHFMWGVQPTFEMPPPATIYGHICSTVGEWIDPAGLEFAYHFTHQGKFNDLEQIHAGGAMGPISPQQRKLLAHDEYTDITMYGEATVMPFTRELLFRPHLTLYLNRIDLEAAFRSPRYAVVFGRSQDLCTYPPDGVRVITLEQQASVYYEHTLLPLSMGTLTRRGVAVMMPQFVDYQHHRKTTFAQYLLLQERVLSNSFELAFTHRSLEWSDPTAPTYQGIPRAVVWHRFTGEH